MQQREYISKLVEMFKDVPTIKCKLHLTPRLILNSGANGNKLAVFFIRN